MDSPVWQALAYFEISRASIFNDQLEATYCTVVLGQLTDVEPQ